MQEVARPDFDIACPWLEESPLDWVHRVPVLVVLSVNTFFLIHVMVVSKVNLRYLVFSRVMYDTSRHMYR